MVNERLYRERETAERIRARYAEDVAEVRANADLSDEGKQRQLAGLYAKAQAELDRHAAAERELLAERTTTLERTMYGPPNTVSLDPASYAISARDASDRAARLEDPTEALDLLRRADTNRDEVLARAIMRRAVERPRTGVGRIDDAWDQVGEAFLDARPSMMSIAEELAEIERMGQRQIFSPFSVTRPRDVPTHQINTAGNQTADAS
jgi:hypothetical protein